MGMSQGNSLYSYLKQTKTDTVFYKIKEQVGRTGPVYGVGTIKGERMWRKGVGG
jgi:hypothetical protein